jgi:glutamyl-tRNA reductase
VIGAGETAELTLRHLSAAGVRDVLVVNRTLARALDLAGRWGGRACNLEGLRETLPLADVVIASSAAPHPVVRAPLAREALEARGGRPVFLIDISMPRNIDPDVAFLEGAYLYNLDDLNAAVRRNLDGREAEVPAVEAILERELARLLGWAAAHEARHVIRAARDRYRDTAERELQKALRRDLRGLDAAQAAAVRDLLGSVVNRLSAPVVEAAKALEARAALEAAFGAADGDAEPEPEPVRGEP